MPERPVSRRTVRLPLLPRRAGRNGLLCATLLALPAPLWAQEVELGVIGEEEIDLGGLGEDTGLESVADEEIGAEPIQLDQIVVTASGFEQSVEDAPASVTVVTRAELEKGNVTSLADALRGVQGVVTTGAAGEEDIYIRGLPGTYTLILIDGKRQGTRESRPNGSSGYEQSFMPPVSAIERIEVVRGPMSSLYGSDAMGGVINIITRSVPKSWGGEVNFESVVPQHSEDGLSGQASFYLTGPVYDDKIGVQVWGRTYARGESHILDGLQGTNQGDITGRVVFTPVEGQEFRLQAGSSRIEDTARGGRTLEEGDPDARMRNNRDHWSITHLGDWGRVNTELSFQQEWGKRTRWTEDDFGVMVKDARAPVIENSVLDAKATVPFGLLGNHTAVLGGQYFLAELTDQNPGSANPGNESFSAYQWALFAEDEWQITPDFSLTYGARYTQHENFGGHVTPRAYAVWNATTNLTVKGGVSTGYKAPDLRSIVPGYYYTTQRGAGVIVSNPDLKPEESTNIELAAIWTSDTYQLGATVYQTDFKDKIESYNTGQPIIVDGTTYNRWDWINVQDARVRGVELTARWDPVETLSFRATYTFTDSEQQSGTYDGLPLARTPKNMATVRGDWTTPIEGLGAWSAVSYHGEEINAGARIGTNGKPYAWNADGDVIAYKYDPYFTWDVGADYALTETVTLKAAVYNLLDERVDVGDSNASSEGRRVWLSLSAAF